MLISKKKCEYLVFTSAGDKDKGSIGIIRVFILSICFHIKNRLFFCFNKKCKMSTVGCQGFFNTRIKPSSEQESFMFQSSQKLKNKKENGK